MEFSDMYFSVRYVGTLGLLALYVLSVYSLGSYLRVLGSICRTILQ